MSKEHNYGIDVLRILLILMIVLGHLLVHTGINEEVQQYSSKWALTWGIQALTVCAVNCFILITGYFSENSCNLRIKKIVFLYGQVFFYSATIYLILLTTGSIEFSIEEAIHSFFPFLSGQYWFFSSYILLLLLAPFLNKMLKGLSDSSLKILLSFLVFFFYVFPMFSVVFLRFDPTDGMGIIGFVTLYIIGQSLKRFNPRISSIKLLAGLVINCLIIFTSKMLLSYVVDLLQLDASSSLLYRYNSIFQLINGILLLLLFSKITLRESARKSVCFFSTSLFGVYLIHEHPALRYMLWNNDLCNLLLDVSLPIYALTLVSIALVVFLACIFVEKARHYLCSSILTTTPAQKFLEKVAAVEKSINSKTNEN